MTRRTKTAMRKRRDADLSSGMSPEDIEARRRRSQSGPNPVKQEKLNLLEDAFMSRRIDLGEFRLLKHMPLCRVKSYLNYRQKQGGLR